MFSLIILTAISVASQTFLGITLLTPYKGSFRETKLKLDFGLSIPSILFSIDTIIEWSFYFCNVSFTVLVKSSTDGSLMEWLSGNDKILAMFKNKTFMFLQLLHR